MVLLAEILLFQLFVYIGCPMSSNHHKVMVLFSIGTKRMPGLNSCLDLLWFLVKIWLRSSSLHCNNLFGGVYFFFHSPTNSWWSPITGCDIHENGDLNPCLRGANRILDPLIWPLGPQVFWLITSSSVVLKSLKIVEMYKY